MEGLTSIVIFGASGDLTGRKLIPSLFSLYCKGRLPRQWRVLGLSRTPFTNEEFQARMEAAVKEFMPEQFEAQAWAEFAPHLAYEPGNLNNVEDFQDLDARLAKMEAEADGPANRLYYLAIAPRLYEATVANLGAAGMIDESHGWRRVVIEKPFGHDLPSAKALNAAVHKVLDEAQIYRIDHYLGKETVQNLLVFRFANSLFEPVWNRNYIDHVQITAAEKVDVGHRAGYYDGVGVMRDMVQNHMLQLLSLVAMEPPASFAADALRNERVKVLASIRPVKVENVARHTVRGQYRGYCEAEGVAPDSQTATYAAMRLYIDNWRWQGVPFYLRSGKALAEKTTEISIFFKRPPHLMFPLPPGARLEANDLSICIQPDEGIHFTFQAKVPDTAAGMRNVDMSFHYADYFGETPIPEAYERLLLDAIKGDAALFTRADTIELSWELVDNILAGWQSDAAPPLITYERGSWGPAEGDALVAHDGFTWLLSCREH
ncbi:MAG: glucose-6-phosphate dehydrogenase [Chloroflexi bacterium]|nr:glucose-6-phosphate dehydrogenase [Chloroflexota bacterium]MCI0649987.1 glucose-6-phosphate dehydrogenase [Chloroflexota bacterium]MCI0727424.1 glucose-6-phosphate dehydrogenase [Chloroflexota bacterium]